MTATELHDAYLSEYRSWSKRKFECKKKGWPWDSTWEGFKGFLLCMKPKPFPKSAYALDREKNGIEAYGPDLCAWKTKTEQNNNKSYNVHFVIPFTEEDWTPQKLAKLHKVQVQTVYKRISQHWSPLELLAGKKSPPLRALWVELDKLPVPSPASKKISNPLKLPPFRERHPDAEWPFCEADVLHEEMTGERIDTEYAARRADYDSIAAWVAIVNAGLPVPPLPELKVLKFTPPTPERIAQIYGKPAKPSPKPKVAPSVIGYAPDDPEDDYDPADCMPDPDEDY